MQNDKKTFITIERHGNYTISSTQDLHINHYYQGRDNYMLIHRSYDSNFICVFDMQYFPFDTQACNMTFILQVSVSVKNTVWCLILM
jgi:hypothetical protein